MTITEKLENNVLTLALEGELDLTGGPALTAYLNGRLPELEGIILSQILLFCQRSQGILLTKQFQKDKSEFVGEIALLVKPKGLPPLDPGSPFEKGESENF